MRILFFHDVCKKEGLDLNIKARSMVHEIRFAIDGVIQDRKIMSRYAAHV